MLEEVPHVVRQAMSGAARTAAGRRGGLHLRIGDAVFPLLRMWEDGMAIDASRLTRLRGLAEIHEGEQLRWSCLIVASEIREGELICGFKRLTVARTSAPADYAPGDDDGTDARPGA
jgi:hypothetical protein